MSDKPKIGFGAQAEPEPKKPRKRTRKNSELPALTPRQGQYVKGRENGLSKRQAALAANYPQSMADSPAATIETPAVKNALRVAMDRAGITEDLIARRLRRNMNAQTVKTATLEGKITHVRRFRDVKGINDTIRLASELRGDLKPDNVGNQNQVVVIIDRVGRPRSADSVAAAAGNFMVSVRPKSG